ncbi:MAG: DUF1003 domain-containing protein [Hyphomicrobiaceae bacterium]
MTIPNLDEQAAIAVAAAAANEQASANKRVTCALSGKEMARRKTMHLGSLRPSLVDAIRAEHPEIEMDAPISIDEIGKYRSRYVEEMLMQERGELSDLDRRVAESLEHHETIAENVEEEYEDQRTTGEKLSDQLAAFGGSWSFLIVFFAFVLLWMALNIFQGAKGAFDAYPFILLNLILSTIAAIQAPIIMMSQRRVEEKDRLRSENDYKVNLKAELEIRHLHEKVDHLLTKQWERLIELQQLQLEVLQERKKKKV